MPLLSDAKKWDRSSAEEQLAWISEEADNAIAVIGHDSGWYNYSPEFPWPEQREKTLANLIAENCRPNQEGAQPGRFELDLSTGPIPEPFEAAKRLRVYWAEQGWTITDIAPLGSTKDPMDYFRADREDGAIMSFNAGELSSSLSFSSSCSELNQTF